MQGFLYLLNANTNSGSTITGLNGFLEFFTGQIGEVVLMIAGAALVVLGLYMLYKAVKLGVEWANAQEDDKDPKVVKKKCVGWIVGLIIVIVAAGLLFSYQSWLVPLLEGMQSA